MRIRKCYRMTTQRTEITTLAVAVLAVAATAGWGLWSAPSAHAGWPDLDAPKKTGESPAASDAAIVVGVERYAFVPKVPGAAENAAEWYTWLTRGRGLDATRVFLLRDAEGTRENLLDVADKAAAAVGKGATLWVVFVGHGAPGDGGRDGRLVGVDAQQTARSLAARSVGQNELLGRLKSGKQARTMMIVDSCFSGRSGDGRPLAPALQPLLPVAAMPATPGLTVLSAGRGDEYAGPLPQAERPAFSYLVLGALRGWGDSDKDGTVTSTEAVSYARDVLRVFLKDRTQTPQLSTAEPDLALASEVDEDGPDLATIALETNRKAANAVQGKRRVAAGAGKRGMGSVWKWVALVGAAGAAATGAFQLYQAVQLRDEVEQGRAGSMDQATALEKEDEASKKELIGYIAVGVAGAAAILTVILFIEDGNEPETTVIGPAVGLNGVGVGVLDGGGGLVTWGGSF